ncbi:hypothetical protein CARUB_v10016454mg [Capsella rubella]|uniref:Uncharacterized protein n=2 Tax=Capsella rubella TaxID=81985 RepID=R0GBY9_9BRAS|nr:hypothetical protein CARUB_v10016454mg [Capsella rubella]
MKETRGSHYTANVTIFNYLKYHDIEGPWALKWIWVHDEILLSTVGAKSSNFTLRHVKNMNRITIVDLPTQLTDYDGDFFPQENVPICCKGDAIPWFREAADGLEIKSSAFSFQIAVGRANLKYHLPATSVTLDASNMKYTCGKLVKVTGDSNAWSMKCVPSSFRALVFRAI